METDKKDYLVTEITETKVLTKRSKRYWLLLFACSLTIGSFFVYDNPAALETQLKSVIFT